jgi:hypothetical protein
MLSKKKKKKKALQNLLFRFLKGPEETTFLLSKSFLWLVTLAVNAKAQVVVKWLRLEAARNPNQAERWRRSKKSQATLGKGLVKRDVKAGPRWPWQTPTLGIHLSTQGEEDTWYKGGSSSSMQTQCAWGSPSSLPAQWQD